MVILSLSKPEEFLVSIVMNVNENTEVTDELLAGYKDSSAVIKEALKDAIEDYKKTLRS